MEEPENSAAPSEAPVRLSPRDSRWPASFVELEAAPDALWVVGRVELLARRPCVAIVGSRAPTPYGDRQARRFATRLAEAGVLVVSGLARGIDAAAHEAALDVGGATLAFLGSGVDAPWPPGPLAERMAVEGALVSEFAPGVGPRRHHFPLRNRLISGLADAVLVVEAAHASGSLITARWAADQGRTVFALPGRVDHPMARGCHRLLREGATLVESPEEVIDEVLAGGAAAATRARSEAEPASEIERALAGETRDLDELARELGRPVAEVAAELVALELDGRVVRRPGGLFDLA